MCWHCKAREAIQYKEDPQGTLRCPGCGELEKDDPSLKTEPAAPRAAAKRTASRSK